MRPTGTERHESVILLSYWGIVNGKPLARSAPADGHPRWPRLASYTVGPADAALPFTARLARENGWTATHAERVVAEYRRFCFLALVADHPVTPSDAVDQAWHLHLTYTRDYWERFCPDVLGRALHHGPTAGGADEQGRFCRQYAQTMRAYEHWFGEAPPVDLWPDAHRRLVEDPRARRVHPRDALILPRRPALLALVALALAACLLLLKG